MKMTNRFNISNIAYNYKTKEIDFKIDFKVLALTYFNDYAVDVLLLLESLLLNLPL